MRFIKIVLWEIFDIVSFLIFVGGIVLFIRFFIFNPFTVVGSSMMSTIKENDILIVDKVTPRFREYQKNDVIIFVPQGKKDAFVKRIIGVPGETIMIKFNEVYVCDFGETDVTQCDKVDEPYLDEGTRTAAMCRVDRFDVTSGAYFVLGDNRPGSTDSRCCFAAGCSDETPYLVPEDHIIGRASIRLLPLQDFRTF